MRAIKKLCKVLSDRLNTAQEPGPLHPILREVEQSQITKEEQCNRGDLSYTTQEGSLENANSVLKTLYRTSALQAVGQCPEHLNSCEELFREFEHRKHQFPNSSLLHTKFSQAIPEVYK